MTGKSQDYEASSNLPRHGRLHKQTNHTEVYLLEKQPREHANPAGAPENHTLGLRI